MRRRRLGNALLAVGLAAIVLIGIEWVARRLEPEDERTRALRDTPLASKAEDTFRIVALGSSNVFGAPVPALGFVAQIQYWLERSAFAGRVELVNLGVPAATAPLILEKARRASTQSVDLFLIHTGFGPFLFSDEPILARDVLREATRRSALVRMMRRQTAFRAEMRAGVHEPSLYVRGSAEYERRVEIWKQNVEAIVDVARGTGAPVLLATNIGNLADWPPFDPRRVDTQQRLRRDHWLAEIERLLDAGEIDSARRRVEQAFGSDPSDATPYFVEAKVAAAMGDYALARDLFARARDLDPVPFRPPTEANAWVRDLARKDDVFLVDLERVLEANAPHGLVGFELIFDTTHPTPRGSALIARAFLATMAEQGLVISPEEDLFAMEDPLEPFLEQVRRDHGGRGLEVAALMNAGAFCMRHPFYRLAEARRHFERARVMDPSNWRVSAYLASIALLNRDLDAGLDLLNAAVVQRGGAEGIEDDRQVAGLKRTIERAGITFDSVTGAYVLR